MSDGLHLFTEEPHVTADVPKNTVERDMHATFVTELAETLQNLETSLIDLEASPTNSEKMNHCFRLFHNLKGSSSMMEFHIIKEIAHYAESLLDLGRKGKILLNSKHIDLFLEAMTSLRVVSDSLSAGKGQGENRYFGLLQKIIDATKEGLGLQPEATTLSTESKQNDATGGIEKKQVNDQVKVSRAVIEQMMLLVGEFMQLKNKIHWLKSRYKDRDYYDNCQELDQFSAKLQRNILKLRLSPVKPVLDSMRRVARTTSQQVNKKIELDISGEETLLDRTILDILADPLMHIIRNAIDHGIEKEQERTGRNKPAAGHVHLKASYKAGEVHISITDDGAGISAERLKRKAVEKGVLTESQVAQMTPSEAYQIIFLPGFSGAEKITETSGRGVGLDVVKEALQKVGGQVEVQTEFGSGTTFTLRLPLSLAIVECLGFKVDEQTYAIPQLNVEEVLSRESKFVSENLQVASNGSAVLLVRETPLPVIRLAEVIGEVGSRSFALIIVRHGKSRFVIEVGQIIGPISIVSQPLPPTFAKDAPFSGITKQGDGSLLFQLDIAKLFKHIEARAVTTSKPRSHNRGAAGLDQENSLLNSSEIKRLQQKTIVFKNNLHFCIPVQRAKRIIYVQDSEIKELGSGEKSFITVENVTVPLVWVEELVLGSPRIRQQNYSVILIQHSGSFYGIPMGQFIGIERLPDEYSTDITKASVLGSTVIKGETCLALDIPTLIKVFQGKIIDVENTVKKPVRILCAEDDKFFAAELTSTLTGAGYEVVMCQDGLHAKELLSDPDVVQDIDLVITDIEMPRMTGLALTRWMKNQVQVSDLPIIAYTAITTIEMQEKMKSAGAAAFISKMSLDELVKTVERVLNSGDTPVDSALPATIVNSDRVVTFKLGSDWYALPMENIKEVSPTTLTASIPKMPEWLSEVGAFRGSMIPILDLHGYFGIEACTDSFDQAIVEADGVSFGVRVGKIGEVILKSHMVQGDGMASISDETCKISRFISGIYAFEGRVISLINPLTLVSICQKTSSDQIEGIAA